jgi:hypothetical protein
MSDAVAGSSTTGATGTGVATPPLDTVHDNVHPWGRISGVFSAYDERRKLVNPIPWEVVDVNMMTFPKDLTVGEAYYVSRLLRTSVPDREEAVIGVLITRARDILLFVFPEHYEPAVVRVWEEQAMRRAKGAWITYRGLSFVRDLNRRVHLLDVEAELSVLVPTKRIRRGGEESVRGQTVRRTATHTVAPTEAAEKVRAFILPLGKSTVTECKSSLRNYSLVAPAFSRALCECRFCVRPPGGGVSTPPPLYNARQMHTRRLNRITSRLTTRLFSSLASPVPTRQT